MRFKKTYKDSDEEANRHAIFSTTVARINKLNQAQIDDGMEACFGITWMSDRLNSVPWRASGLRAPSAVCFALGPAAAQLTQRPPAAAAPPPRAC